MKVSWARIANAALGLWLMAAPAVLDYDDPAQTNDRIVGPLVAAMAIIALWDVTRALRFVNVALGGWLIVSSFALGYPSDALGSAVLSGLLIIVFGLNRGPLQGRYGGGWRELW